MTFKPAVSLTEQIASHLADEIIAGRMAPRERIQELKLARELGVSRGSVREALLILESRHLIDIIPRRGAVVSSLGQPEVGALFEVFQPLLASLLGRVATHWRDGQLMALEGIANHLRDSEAPEPAQVIEAAGEFLQALLPIAGNPYMTSLVDGLLPVLQRVLHQLFARLPEACEATIHYLDTVLDALHERDVPRLAALTCEYCSSIGVDVTQDTRMRAALA